MSTWNLVLQAHDSWDAVTLAYSTWEDLATAQINPTEVMLWATEVEGGFRLQLEAPWHFKFADVRRDGEVIRAGEGIGLIDGQWVGYDYEAPIGQQVAYTVSLYESVIGASGTETVLATNTVRTPSLETTWSGGSPRLDIAYSTAWVKAGAQSATFTVNDGTTTAYLYPSVAQDQPFPGPGGRHPLQQGEPVWARASVRAETAVRLRATCVFYKDDLSGAGTVHSEEIEMTAGQERDFTWTALPTTDAAGWLPILYFYAPGSGYAPVGTQIHLDAFIVTAPGQSLEEYGYFDGDHPDAVWLGTPHASTSQLTGPYPTPRPQVTLSATYGHALLHNVIDPASMMEPWVEGVDSVTRQSRTNVYEVVGRTRPVVVSQSRGSRQGAIRLFTTTLGQRDALWNLLDAGDVLLFRSHPDFGVGNLYVVIDAAEEERVTRLGWNQLRRWTLEYIETDPPVGAAITSRENSWEAVRTGHTDWQAVLNVRASWTEVLTDTTQERADAPSL